MSKKNKIINPKNIDKELQKRIKRAQLVEKICRQHCAAQGYDPERLVCKMMPEYLNYPYPGFFVPNPQYTFPAWWLFKELVEETLKALGK